MKVTCPKCHSDEFTQFTVETDTAGCSRCNEVFQLSGLIADRTWQQYLNKAEDPPAGIVVSQLTDGWKIEASTKNPIMLLWMIPITLAFSLVAVFAAAAWIEQGRLFNIIAIVFVSVFGWFSFWLLWTCLLAACGRIEILDDQGEGRIFTGIGNIGFRKRFSWSDVEEVEEEPQYYQGGKPVLQIKLIGPNVSFGASLPEPRRQWIAEMLYKIVSIAQSKKQTTDD